MDYRKSKRSPRRDYAYSSPSRRHHRSRTRSRSPYRRSSPFERRPSRTSPKQKRSRSRSPRRGYRDKLSNGYRRSRSIERKSRTDFGKPKYAGPEYCDILERAVLSPNRLVVVRKTGSYDDNDGRDESNDREVLTDKRTTNEARANTDDQDGLKRYVYIKKQKAETIDGVHTNYTNARGSRDDRHSPVSGTYSESEAHKKNFGRPRGSDRTEEFDRSTDRYRKQSERRNNGRRSNDRCYDGGKPRSVHKRENSRERRQYDRDDDKRAHSSRDRKQRDHRYQNGDRKKSDDKNDTERNVEIEAEENDESHLNGNNVPVANGAIPPIIPPIRPPYVGPFARVVPMAPFPMPAFRPPPPPMMARFSPYIARPFRIPPPRLFPPARFYPPVPPMY